MTNMAPERLANAIRFLAIDAIVKAKEGHQGVPLGMAEIATALFTRHLKFAPHDPAWFDRDRFVLSNGHGSMLLYALLCLTGYERINLDQVKSFREMGSHCAGHPERDLHAGIEVTTGPLGQGIANALGMAVAEASLRARFGAGLVNHYTYAFVGDGCLQEGIGQETIALAGHLRLGHLIFFWDDNRITDDGSTDLSISEDVAARFRIAGWHVLEVDGHDVDAVSAAIASAKDDPRPSLIACRTIIAKGIARLQGQRGGHSARLFEEDAKAARNSLDWNYGAFEIPEDVSRAWRDAGRRSVGEHQAWQARVAALPASVREEFRRVVAGELPQSIPTLVKSYKEKVLADPVPRFGIGISGDIVETVTPALPECMVACADLEAPTNHKRGRKAFSAAEPDGSYIHCGVREHVMGAMANGMAAHGGVIPLSVTYLAFSDYERPAMRMAALMGLPVLFVFSHDSIGIGRNGPTHQPVEILASLRAMPNMLVMRPADAIEAAECWELALSNREGPSSLVFARQELEALRRDGSENRSAFGAYVLREAKGVGRNVTLIATGSEVALAVRAAELLEAHGVPVAVVSAPCWELFDRQPAAYRNTVLQPGSVRIGIEAAVRQGWDRYIGDAGGFIGMAGFGASGPADELYRHFGITPEAVVTLAKEMLAGAKAA